MILSADEVVEVFFKPLKPGGDYKISTTKLYRLAKLGKIPSFKLDGRVFFDEDTLKAWFNAKSQTPGTITDLDRYERDYNRKMKPLPEDMSTYK
jgi:hypothetical protein